MYYLKTEESFDAAHFLAGYEGKCSNLHGHRWRVVAIIGDEKLHHEGQMRGMVVDFGDVKNDLKDIVDFFDHAFIYEEGTLKQTTIQALEQENFRLIEMEFRPTAEEFSRYFYKKLEQKGYFVKEVQVYETPNNCAIYQKE